jgi:hypothetical protein
MYHMHQCLLTMDAMAPRLKYADARRGLAAALVVIVAVATSPGTCTPPKPESEIRVCSLQMSCAYPCATTVIVQPLNHHLCLTRARWTPRMWGTAQRLWEHLQGARDHVFQGVWVQRRARLGVRTCLLTYSPMNILLVYIRGA